MYKVHFLETGGQWQIQVVDAGDAYISPLLPASQKKNYLMKGYE
jgi:hypothetical protein